LLRFARTILILTAALIPLSGCLLRTHQVQRTARSDAPLLAASVDQLVSRINAEAAKVKTMNATVDIAPSVGGEKKGKVTEYQEIRGYVLLKKPNTLRMIGLFPVVRNKAFDMVSEGDRFKLLLPTRGKFFVGSQEVKVPSKQPLENLRPQHILDAMLVKEIDPQNEIAVLENSTEQVRDTKTKKEVEQANYVLNVARRDQQGKWYLARKIYFNRVDLLARKQVIYDRFGSIATIAQYDNYSDMSGLLFPNIIQVDRPQEEYSIQLGMIKLRLNEELKDSQFELAQPPNATLIDLDKRNAEATTTNEPQKEARQTPQ
jgi:outer membrane lipoprotein-sorting protein